MTVWLQLKNPRRIRAITATGLAWVFGRAVTVTVQYAASGTSVKIETFIHRQESTPEASAGAFTVVPSTDPVKTLTVGQEQIAIDLPYDAVATSSSALSAVQLSPFPRNTATAVATTDVDQGRNFAVNGQIQRIIDTRIDNYIRFTESTPGTLLPTGGLYVNRDHVVAMFTTEPSASQL